MKKMFKLIISFALIFSCVSVCSFAAESISVGEITEASKAVEVNFTIEGLEDGDDVTILVFKKELAESTDPAAAPVYAEPSEDNIVYINQVSADNSKISFNLLSTAAEGLYEVRMGGTGIETASIGTFTISSITYGDLDNDGVIDAFDAVWILKYASGAELPDGVTVNNGDVDGDGVIDAFDAVWVLKYASGAELPDGVLIGK